MDRCALFVDAGYMLADGAMAVHGTRNRESVSWDYAGVIQFLGNMARDRTGLPLLRCYWYEATVEGRRTPEHDALADLPGVKLRLGRLRPGRREGVESEIHRDLTTLARNHAASDALVVSAEEDLAQVIADVQDLGMRVTIVHITVGGNWTISRTLRQECDGILEIGEAHLRPYVELLPGVEPMRDDDRQLAGAYARSSNGHGPVGALTHQPALPAGSHPAPPAIYTAPVIAEYQRVAQPMNGQPPALPVSNASGPIMGPGAGQQQSPPAAPSGQPSAPQAGAAHPAGLHGQQHNAAQQMPAPVPPGGGEMNGQGSGAGQAGGPSAQQGVGQQGMGQQGVGQQGVGQQGMGQQGMGQQGMGQQGMHPGQSVQQQAANPLHGQPPAAAHHVQHGPPLQPLPPGLGGPAGMHTSGPILTNGAGGQPGQAMPPHPGGGPGQAAGPGQPAGPMAGQPGMPQQTSPRPSAMPGQGQPGMPGAPGHGASQGQSAGSGQPGMPGAVGSPGGGHQQSGQPGQPPAMPPQGQPGGPMAGQPGMPPPGHGPAMQPHMPQQAMQPPGMQHSQPMYAAPPAQPGFRGPGQEGQGQQGPAGVRHPGASDTVNGGPSSVSMAHGGPGPVQAPPRPLPGDPSARFAPGPHDPRADQYPGPAGPAGPMPPGAAYIPPQGPYSGPQPAAQHAPSPQPVAVSLADAVQAAHGEGFQFGQAVARDAPALWLEAVVARKPRMPSDLEARLLQDSALPIDSLLHDEVRHALRRGFWDALERARH